MTDLERAHMNADANNLARDNTLTIGMQTPTMAVITMECGETVPWRGKWFFDSRTGAMVTYSIKAVNPEQAL